MVTYCLKIHNFNCKVFRLLCPPLKNFSCIMSFKKSTVSYITKPNLYNCIMILINISIQTNFKLSKILPGWSYHCLRASTRFPSGSKCSWPSCRNSRSQSPLAGFSTDTFCHLGRQDHPEIGNKTVCEREKGV